MPATLLNVETVSPGQMAGFVPLWTGESPTLQIASSALFQSGSKILPQTSGSTVGVISLGGAPFMHAFFAGHGQPDNTLVGFSAGNFTMTGPNNTAIGQDALHANTHRIQVEEEKPIQERGRYLHPELFAASQEKAIGYSAPPPSTMAIPEQFASTVSRPIIETNSQ